MNRIAKQAIAVLLAMNVVITSGFDGNIQAFASNDVTTVDTQDDTVVENGESKTGKEEDVSVKATKKPTTASTTEPAPTLAPTATPPTKFTSNVTLFGLDFSVVITDKQITNIYMKKTNDFKGVIDCSTNTNLLESIINEVKIKNPSVEIKEKDKFLFDWDGDFTIDTFKTGVSEVSALDKLSKDIVEKSSKVVFTNEVDIDATALNTVNDVTFEKLATINIDSPFKNFATVTFKGIVLGSKSIGTVATVNILAENSAIIVEQEAFNSGTIAKLLVSTNGTANGSVTLKEEAFTGCTVTEAEFSGNITLEKNSIYDTTFTNWYLNHVNFDNIEVSPYKNNSNPSVQTNITIVGGVANSSSYMTLPTVVKNWFSSYKNTKIITGTPSITYSDKLTSSNVSGADALIKADYRNGYATIDFSKMINVTNTFTDSVANKYGLSKQLTWTNNSNYDGASCYRVWKQGSAYSSGSIEYEKNNSKYYYNVLASSYDTVTSGTYNYLIEANGVLKPISIFVDDVKSLRIVSVTNANNGNVVYKVEDNILGIDDYIVYAEYQYSGAEIVDKSQINQVVTKADAPKIGCQYSEKTVRVSLMGRSDKFGTVILRGYAKKVSSFSVSLRKYTYYVGETIYAKDLSINNILYSNALVDLSADPTKSVAFRVNNQNVSSVTLNDVGDISLSVVYDDCVVNNAVKVSVTAATIAPTNNVVVTATPTAKPVVTGTAIATKAPVNFATSAPAVPNGQPLVSATPTLVVTPTPMVTNETKKETVELGKKYYVNGIQYKVTEISTSCGNVTIVGYDKSAKKAVYKSTVTIMKHKFRVTCIAKKAFKGCKILKGNVDLGNYVTSIGNEAFSGCKNVTNIVIGKKVKSIGKKAFFNCNKVVGVDFRKAKSLKSIGAKAFVKLNKNVRFRVKCNAGRIVELMKGKY